MAHRFPEHFRALVSLCPSGSVGLGSSSASPCCTGRWPPSFRRETPGFGTYLYFSGTTFFTLGYGDLVTTDAIGRVLSVAEAGLGFVFLAVIITYLPVLYQSFSRREVGISLLDARAALRPLLVNYSGALPMAATQRVLLPSWSNGSDGRPSCSKVTSRSRY